MHHKYDYDAPSPFILNEYMLNLRLKSSIRNLTKRIDIYCPQY